jgi:hypothetical protein
MMDSLAMFFGAKKRKVKRSPSRKHSPSRKVRRPHGSVAVRGRERKLYKGSNGGLYYKTKSGRAYVDSKFIRRHRVSPKRNRKSPKRNRKSPKRKSPKRKSPKRKSHTRRTRYGYGLGQPSLIDMMGPAGLAMIPSQHLLGPGGMRKI